MAMSKRVKSNHGFSSSMRENSPIPFVPMVKKEDGDGVEADKIE
jgi:hypothetical protein